MEPATAEVTRRDRQTHLEVLKLPDHLGLGPAGLIYFDSHFTTFSIVFPPGHVGELPGASAAARGEGEEWAREEGEDKSGGSADN